jgi:hypothetical protein
LPVDATQLLTPVIFAIAVAAIVIFGPRRGRMLPDEKARVFRTLRTWVSVAVTGVASVSMERWLGAHFGLSYWASLGVMLGIAAVIGLLGEGVRALMGKRAENAA